MLEETDRLFYCEFCRVKSFLLPKTFFQYMFSGNAPSGKRLFYFPFWRFKGMFFSCSPNGIQHRFMDLSHQAIESRLFPVSVGLRSQSLQLRFVSADTGGRFLTPAVPVDRVMDIFDRRYTTGLARPMLYRTHIGESLSLIYSPFYAEDRLYDGILNQPVGGGLPDDFDAESLPGGSAKGRIRFIPTLCPNCGWDLDGGRDAVVLACKNCTSMWQGGSGGFTQIRFAHVPAREAPVVYLPFWRIKTEVSEIRLDSYADLVRAANLPKVIQPGWDGIGFRFWAPAFKVRPRTFLRLSTVFALSQPRDRLEAAIPKGRVHPINLSITEAIKSLKMTLAGFLKPKERLVSMLPDIRIRAVSYLLVYVPFVEKHHELVHPGYQTAVNKNQLRLSANL